MKTAVLNILTHQLTHILRDTLPKISTSWWTSLVIEKLTFQQQSFARQHSPDALEQLDLAALLRVADQNWYKLSQQRNLDKTVRNWLKEAQTIRNRWAHAPAGDLPDEVYYRDLDTIERLLQVFAASAEVLNKISGEKQNLLLKLAANKASTLASTTENAVTNLFKSGDMVRLKAKPQTSGAVIAHLPGVPEDRYQVFHDGTTPYYYASQIEPIPPVSTHSEVALPDLHAALSALQLRHPSIRHLYSLFASRIQFVPYQFRPVLKLIQADRPRLLIADEVGVGKTIEAGLILKELQARREIKSVLVICPKPLIAERKWLEEMKRFDERFEHLDGKSLRYCINETHFDGIWPQKHARVIVPYSLLDESLLMGKHDGRKKQHGLLDLDPPPAFDLVIVDEAHHIRNTDTWAYRNVRHFCDNAEAVVLLSATPIQMRDNDLYTLLHLIRPDVLTSRRDFEHMAEPNPHLNDAIEAARSLQTDWQDKVRTHIDSALATTWGRGVLAAGPGLQSAYDLLDADHNDPAQRLALIRQLEELYTFASLINRTRRRDIGNFTTRKQETVTVEFTPEQADLHQNLINLMARILAFRHGDQNLRFMLSTVRQQVSSCVFGLAPRLKDMLQQHLSQLELSELDYENSPDDIQAILAEFRADVEALIRQAQQLTGHDPKLEAFLKVIRDKQQLPNNKLLAFSSFRHTIRYLEEQLSQEPVRFGIIHGGVADDERRAIRNRFSMEKAHPNALDVLLSSEVGCEGLDYQFCDGMINYDLPWNPMRVEQRIGRIDRYGQLSPTVVIYNLITPGTVDAEIYERCLLRIGIFRQALGSSEEILGKLTQEIHAIAENFDLTPDEQAARLQQIADNDIRLIQEQARLEEQQAQLFGLMPGQHTDEMIKQAASFWLSPAMLVNLISRYLQTLGVTNLPASLGQKPLTTLQLGQDIRSKLLADYQKLDASGETAQIWSRWLTGNEPNLPLTFDASTAAERRDLLFITPTHPLTRQAAQSLEPRMPLHCDLSITIADLPAGRYPFAIYRWRKLGLREDFTFQPISQHPELTERMLELLEIAQPIKNTVAPISADEKTALEQAHYPHWSNSRAAHIEQVTQTTQARLASLNTSHAARLALLEEQRDMNPDEKIQRMKNSQIASASRDY